MHKSRSIWNDIASFLMYHVHGIYFLPLSPSPSPSSPFNNPSIEREGGREVDNGGAEAHLQFARKMQRYAQPNIIEQTNKQANGKTHMDKFICFVHTQ